MRSNSELRDFIVVTHAEKHNKYSRRTAKLKHHKSDSIQNSPSIRVKKTATLRRIESSPVIKMDVTENLAEVNQEFDDIVSAYKKADSIKTLSSASIDDSECSYSSISTDIDSSFEGNNDRIMTTLKRASVTEHKNREIIYRMAIKDKLTLWQKSNKTIFHSRIQIKKALKTFDVHDYYIEGAIKKYEVCN